METLDVVYSTPVAARSKAWVCCRLFGGIAGSNPAVSMDVCLLWMFVLSGRGLRVKLITRLEVCPMYMIVRPR